MLRFTSTMLALASLLAALILSPLYHSHRVGDHAHGERAGAQMHAHVVEVAKRVTLEEQDRAEPVHVSEPHAPYEAHGKAVDAFLMQPSAKVLVMPADLSAIAVLDVSPLIVLHLLPEQPVRVHGPPGLQFLIPRSPPASASFL
jgi:hypothetical protein